MSNNTTNINGGFAYGSDTNALPQSPFVSYVVYPKAIADSAQMPAQLVTQSLQPTWVLNDSQASGVPAYVLKDQLQWAVTFPSQSIGTQTAIYEGSPVIVLDCARCVNLTFSAATTVGVTLTINGWDIYGVPMVEESNQVSGITSYVGYKAFSIIKSVYFSSYPWSSNGNTVLVQGGNFIGLPYFVNSDQTVSLVSWQQQDLANDLAYSGNEWRVTPPSPTTADARGTINLTAVSPLPNGQTQLQVDFYAYGFDQVVNNQLSYVLSQPTGTVTYNYDPKKNIGSCIQIAGISNNTSNVPKLTRLVNQDRFGSQFPGDLDFSTYYQTL